MAVTVRGSSWGGASSNSSELLVAYINEEIKTLEPQLQFARLGVRRDAPKGYDRILFPQSYQLPVKGISSMMTTTANQQPGSVPGVWGYNASVTSATGVSDPNSVTGIWSSVVGVAAITEGTNPTAVTWGATAYSSGPYQYGLLIQVSDLLVHNSAIEVVDSCTRQVKNALARFVDSFIQTVVNAGTNGVVYAGGRTSRANVAAGDLLTQTEMTRAYKYLAASNAAGLQPFEGKYYAAVIHPQVEADLMSATGAGNFVDVGRYTSVDDLRAGAMQDYRGIRYLRSAWVSYFQSTVNVFPTTVVGAESFGWGYFQPPTPTLVTTPDSSNALNLYTSIGGKVTLGATRFEDTAAAIRIVRVESAISN